MDDYKIIVEQDHSTVMAHYEVEAKPKSRGLVIDLFQKGIKDLSLLSSRRTNGLELSKLVAWGK